MTDIYDQADDYREEDAAEWNWHDDEYGNDSPEPDWGYEEWVAESARHSDEVHGGADCNCPEPEPAAEPPGGYSDDAPF